MKILLIYTNRNRYLNPPPIGLAYLIPSLQKRGHEVRMLDLMFSNDPGKAIIEAIQSFKPQLAGFSIRNLDNQFMLDLKDPIPEIREYVSIAQKCCVKTVLGGTAFTTFPMEMMEYMGADYGIAGQGEQALPLLIDAIKSGNGFHTVPGLVYRDGADVLCRNEPAMNGYSGDEMADWSLIDIQRYKKNALLTPPAAVVIKTGCPYECSFCDAQVSMGDRFILRPVDAIIEEIKRLKKELHCRNFFFVDPCFNTPLDYSKEILERFIREKIDIRFVCHLEPAHNTFDEELFRLLKKAGVQSTMSDCASFSNRMLKNYRKAFTTDDIRLFSRLARKHGLCFGASILIGGPGETHDTIAESMDFLPSIDYAFLSYAIGVRISPHTALYNTALQEGLVKNRDELLFSKFYVSKDIDVAWAKKYMDKALRKYNYRYGRMLPLIFRNLMERPSARSRPC